MNEWKIEFLEEAKKDLLSLDNSLAKQILKGIKKVSQNPVSTHTGGYGKPLGNKRGLNLSGLYKIKFKSIGIRVVYGLVHSEQEMKITVISLREDFAVYSTAERRKNKYNL